MKNAYVIMHFGNKTKYLEYEMYSVIMLKKIRKSNQDIVYMYSTVDTPEIFVDVMKKMNVVTVPFDDTYIVELSKSFSSTYEHFNTLRTCCFVFANMLTDYNKLCIVETDIIFRQGFDKVFNLKAPAMKFYPEGDNVIHKRDEYSNIKIYLNWHYVKNICSDTMGMSSPGNGGVLLIKPNPKLLEIYKTQLTEVIVNKCIYPNEILMILMYEHLYNLPRSFNIIGTIPQGEQYAFHLSGKLYKHLDVIRDNYIDKIKFHLNKQMILYFKDEIYEKCKNKIDNVMKKVRSKVSD